MPGNLKPTHAGHRPAPPIASRKAVAVALALALALVLFALRAQAQGPRLASTKPDVDAHYQKTCIGEGCHTPQDKGMPRHVPFLEGQCLACHFDHTSDVKGLLKPGGDAICLGCHTQLERAADGKGLAHGADGKACLDCHAPHQSRVRTLLRNDADLLLCAKCHADFLAKSAKEPYRHQHFDVQSQCGNCHLAHENSADHHLRPNVRETCLTCHDLPIRSHGRTLENIAEELRTLPYQHAALEESKGSCPTCHTPHGSTQPSLLNPGYPAGSYESYSHDNYALCWMCHDSKLAESANGVGVTNFRNGDQNLHRVHVVELKRGRGCLLCHSAHASAQQHLMRREFRMGDWVAPMEWRAESNGGQCTTACHRPRQYSRASGGVPENLPNSPDQPRI